MKFKLFGGFFAVVLLLTGCMGADKNEEGRGVRNTDNFENTRFNDTTRNNDITNNVSNKNSGNTTKRNGSRYELSREAADRIVKEMDEIDGAYVITTDNNAFVGAVLANNRNGGDDNGGTNDNNSQNRGMMGKDANTEGRGTTDRTNMSGNQDMNVGNDLVKSGSNNSDDVGLDSMRGTRESGHDVTDDVKERITKIVQEIDDNIDNVYVSTSPDFINLAEGYGNDLDNGRPVRGFFDQIGNMIERAFPQNSR